MNFGLRDQVQTAGRTSDEGGEAGGRDRNQIVAHTGYVSPHAFAARPGRPRIGVNAQFSGIAPQSAQGMNDEQVQHVDSVSSGLGTVGATAWGCR
jgi:hypothetical protein